MTPEENVRLWLAHLSGEFSHRDVEESLATMTEDATVCHVPTGSGGSGKSELRRYYRDEFIPSIPEDWTHTLTSRLATAQGIAEEARLHFHHTKQMDWFLPGIAATGKLIETEIVVFIDFRDGLMAAERIYWDQASVLTQIGRI
ncbi:MAG: nuclear transport factor 2 family protein [Deltaproteobacteria bacterium]|nr:nuclear transport factor 2 family protein [Deltaproteobacteria bacterium]